MIVNTINIHKRIAHNLYASTLPTSRPLPLPLPLRLSTYCCCPAGPSAPLSKPLTLIATPVGCRMHHRFPRHWHFIPRNGDALFWCRTIRAMSLLDEIARGKKLRPCQTLVRHIGFVEDTAPDLQLAEVLPDTL